MEKRQYQSALSRKSDTSRRPPQIDLISHQDTNADMPLVCCLPSMTWTTCVPCLAWRRGTHFVYPNSWSRPPRGKHTRQQQLVLVTHCQRYPVTSNARGNGQWSSGSIFTYSFSLWHQPIRETGITMYLIFWDCDVVFCEHRLSWTPNAPKRFIQELKPKKTKNVSDCMTVSYIPYMYTMTCIFWLTGRCPLLT